MRRRPSVQRAFDEVRFGPSRILNVRDALPSASQARTQAEQWLRLRQVEGDEEVLIITGRGASSEGGIAVVRPAIERLLHGLRRRGVIARFQEHTSGSFAVQLAPLTQLLEAGARRADRIVPPRARGVALTGLNPGLLRSFERLARRALDALGIPQPTEAMVRDEAARQFTLLVAGLPNGEANESQLAAAIARAMHEYEEDAER